MITEMNKNMKNKENMESMENSEKVGGQSGMQYGNCLNCGTELKGMYCHVCGQEATDKSRTVLGFVKEYVNNAFLWDPKFFSTLWTLLRRPGQLTKDFLSGKIISQENPLKLNMFLLLVFITLFVFFSGSEKMTEPIEQMTSDEMLLPGVQMGFLKENPEFVAKVEGSTRDTVQLVAPLNLAEKFPEFFTVVEIKEDTKGESLDTWVAVLPQVLISDNILIEAENGSYKFNTDTNVGREELDMVNSILAEMVRITSQYFPMLLLLTVPFLSFSISFVQRRSRLPQINHFIFALHYTAFLELLIICIFILHLAVGPSMKLMECGLMVASCSYLAIAFRKVYETCSWFKAFVKSIFTSVIYFIILLLIFVVIFFIACIITVVEHV